MLRAFKYESLRFFKRQRVSRAFIKPDQKVCYTNFADFGVAFREQNNSLRLKARKHSVKAAEQVSNKSD